MLCHDILRVYTLYFCALIPDSYHEGSYGNHDTHEKEKKKSTEKAAIFHELTFEGIDRKHVEMAEVRKMESARDSKSVETLETLQHQSSKGEVKPTVVRNASSDMPTFRKGFVHEMARRLEKTLSEEAVQKTTPPKIKPRERAWQKTEETRIGSGVIPHGFQLSKGSGSVPNVSVHAAVRTFEQASSHHRSHVDVRVTEDFHEASESKRQR
ncbi:hypothetical protein COOONC_15884 [Cooperia oncophora]